MIHLLATTCQRKIAFLLFLLFDLSFVFTPLAYAAPRSATIGFEVASSARRTGYQSSPAALFTGNVAGNPAWDKAALLRTPATLLATAPSHRTNGGPTQPEMTSFKPVNASNMVNLFTGDFNYNIPLLDVGGYPVNMYYSGGIGLEQEASWVGLGWNINPGNVNRNMRGIPDDFDGTDTLTETQNLKPNKTWGASVGSDLEVLGIKTGGLGLNVNLGMSFNNYLGPAIDLGVKGGVTFKVAAKSYAEKSAPDLVSLSVGVGVSADINSREGTTISPSVSLIAHAFKQNTDFSEGASIATSYNSRSGIKALQISEQTSMNSMEAQRMGTTGNYGGIGLSLHGTTISFARPSYLPAIRIPMTNTASSGHFQFGAGIFGVYGSLEAEVYQQSTVVSPEKIIQRKPLVGYLYYDKATANPEAVMDFTRFNDREVTPNTPIISAPQYSYDVFTIQGEGTGGSIRAYRNEPGLVWDNHTSSEDKNTGIGFDIGPPGHYGANINLIRTPTEVENWVTGNKLTQAIGFGPKAPGSFENVYFRNPGEACVLDNTLYNRIGGTDLVRFQLSGDAHNPSVEPVLDRFSKAGVLTGKVNAATTSYPALRRKRTQVIDFLAARDASVTGLDKYIKSYDYQTMLDPVTDTLRYSSIQRVGGYRKANHISQINVTEANGRRYVYGLPVYNIRQKDFTFTVSAANSDLTSPSSVDKVAYTANVDNNASANIDINGGTGSRDGYVQIIETPAYAHSFLLSGLLSPDYVDVTGDGISDDDLGDAVKFNYSQILQSGTAAVHTWRSPADLNPNMANFNAGKRTDLNDDKGIISYGERESWYLHSIESKTMIALFTLEDRLDGKGPAIVGPTAENSGTSLTDASSKRLKQIDLYSKSDLKKNGLAKARPIKTVHFAYSYRLCTGTPDNPVGDVTGKGKLTLDSVYFTYNGQNRASKNKYTFSYGSTASDNPSYTFNASDRWGTYKPITMNPVDKSHPNMKNSDFPFTPQEQPGKSSPRPSLNQNAGAWSLKTIVLPSGGQMDVQYESDDYAYVQNLRAMDMMNIVGFSSSPTGTISNRLYDLGWSPLVENNIVFINVPTPCTNDAEVATRYLQGVSQLCFRLGVDMPNGVEYITCYANIVASGKLNATTIWVQLKNVNGISPLSLTAVEYLREQLPGQAFPGYDVSRQAGLQQIGTELAAMWSSLKKAFSDPISTLRGSGKAQLVELGQSFVRLDDPLGFKYGGGHRVKAIALKDNWQAMTKQFTSTYTQTYDYTTTESFNGATRVISSGVASYEPSIGGEENPYQTIVQVSDKLPLGPVSYGAVEMPVLEAFFPAAGIGYSKVTVRSVSSAPPGALQRSRSGIGRQVTQFYTAKDFPVYYNQTGLDPSTDRQAHNSSTTNFFYKYAFDSRTISQGFLVETNDMHGKLRSQTSYADNDTTIRVNYTENFYRNTGVNGLSETFSTVSSAQGGLVTQGNIGVDIELMTDTRQFTINSSSLEVEGQLDEFPIIFPIWLPFIWPVSGSSENDYRAVTTTKVINYHAVLDSVVVYDKGSQVSTKNLVYDGETGDVIVNRTNNEFNQPVYNTTYPAWWAYPGMGPAYVNTGATSAVLTFTDGRITGGSYDPTLFESGDELLMTNTSSPSTCPTPSAKANMIWTLDLNKNNGPFPITTPSLIFIDSAGNPYTYQASVRVVRSGYRNMLDAKLASVTSLSSPLFLSGSTLKISFPSGSQVTSANAVEYSEKWQTDKDAIRTYTTVFNQTSCTSSETPDCAGHLEKTINPYKKGLLGNFRNFRTMIFYANRVETDPTSATTNLCQNGFLSNFALYWDFNVSNQLVPNTGSPYWIESVRTNRVNSRGLEMETKNALNIYTAAQYGYNKTLPVAITNNAPYYQADYEGFEDYNYAQSISNSQVNPCPYKQLDYTSMPNTHVVNTDTTSFTAHTGKYCLALNHNSTGTVNIPITATDNLNYNLAFGSTTTKSLINPGINFTANPPYPNSIYFRAFNNSSGVTGGRISASLESNAAGNEWGYNWDGYIQITAPNAYSFGVSVSETHTVNSGTHLNQTATLSVTGLDNTIYSTKTATLTETGAINDTNSTKLYSVSLCPGIYHIAESGSSFYLSDPPSRSNDQFSWGCNNCTSIVYKDTTSVAGCTTTVPIAGDPTMLNSTFSMPAGQPMLLSAWVRDGQPATATGVTDTAVSYYNSQININTGSASIPLTPSGPVIEGWQRYEGTFTPAASGAGSISFVNSGPNTIYFDDIRLHPFNADMKSYVYDPVNLRLVAELDANNYASFYEYDEEGTLIRTKAETARGIKTIKETRSAKQKNILSDQTQNGSSCGSNCVVAVMQALAGTNTLSYPVGVFNANGKLLGNATNQAQYIILWNADTANANRGTLASGIDSLHFQLTLVAGKTAPPITGCRYYQVDLAYNQIDGVRSGNGCYITFGDGTGMRMTESDGDTAKILAPNTTVVRNGSIYYVHTYPDASLKTLTFYHNDETWRSTWLDNALYPASSLLALTNYRGAIPQYMPVLGGSCYQSPTMNSVANFTNWNLITSITHFEPNMGDHINPCTHMNYAQDFLKNDPGLLEIVTTFGGNYNAKYRDTTFKIHRLKSDWNTFFTHLTTLFISDEHWNREDLSGLLNLNYVGIFATNQNHSNDPTSNSVIPMPSNVIDNILIQIAQGAGRSVHGGSIGIIPGGTTRTSASDAAVALLKANGWSITIL